MLNGFIKIFQWSFTILIRALTMSFFKEGLKDVVVRTGLIHKLSKGISKIIFKGGFKYDDYY